MLTDLEPHSYDTLFSYTSGRFLFNEKCPLQERHVPFHVKALFKAAEHSLSKEHGKIVGISKLGEGGFNRVFDLVSEDVFESIAKILYHSAVPKYFATASEAATLTYLRKKGIPVPRVYGYCANAENPVGAEYILMEKAQGTSLQDTWHTLKDKEIAKLVYSYVQMEQKLFKLPFSATGKLICTSKGMSAPSFKHLCPRTQRSAKRESIA